MHYDMLALVVVPTSMPTRKVVILLAHNNLSSTMHTLVLLSATKE